MKKAVMRLGTLLALGSVAVLGLPASSQVLPVAAAPARPTYLNARLGGLQRLPQATSSKLYIQAAIIPAATFGVGTSLSGGPDGRSYGDGLTANDIDNLWRACSSCDMDFAIFVFSNQDNTATVEFKIVAPGSTVVYHYTWASDKLYVGGNWFSVVAKADYSAPGTYFAEIDVGGQLDGWIPVVFTK